jgi:NAD(P)-dependent dehydrogenase (short-subunit alcohol dehydrogenase family)
METRCRTRRRVIGLAADVTKSEDIESLVTSTIEELGRIDILINSAGAGIRKPILEFEIADWDQVLQI